MWCTWCSWGFASKAVLGNFSLSGTRRVLHNAVFIYLACFVKVFTIPKRSPDLNVMDYAIWAEVEKMLRKQDRIWNKKFSVPYSTHASILYVNKQMSRFKEEVAPKGPKHHWGFLSYTKLPQKVKTHQREIHLSNNGEQDGRQARDQGPVREALRSHCSRIA